MALTLKVDLVSTPITLTVDSDKRKVTGSVTVGGETANYSGAFEPMIVDDQGRKWIKKTDDGRVAVYTG